MKVILFVFTAVDTIVELCELVFCRFIRVCTTVFAVTSPMVSALVLSTIVLTTSPSFHLNVSELGCNSAVSASVSAPIAVSSRSHSSPAECCIPLPIGPWPIKSSSVTPGAGVSVSVVASVVVVVLVIVIGIPCLHVIDPEGAFIVSATVSSTV